MANERIENWPNTVHTSISMLFWPGMHYYNLMEGLLYVEFNVLDSCMITWPKDKMETLFFTKWGMILFNGPKIVVLRRCMEQRYQYWWHYKIIDIQSDDVCSKSGAVRE